MVMKDYTKNFLKYCNSTAVVLEVTFFLDIERRGGVAPLSAFPLETRLGVKSASSGNLNGTRMLTIDAFKCSDSS